MGKVVSSAVQRESAEELINDLNSMNGVEAEVVERKNGTKIRNIVRIYCNPENWRKLAKRMKKKHKVDYCSMITGIHWPEGGTEKNWEIVYHFLRTGITNPPVIRGMIEPIILDPTKVQGTKVPLEIEVKIFLPETREPTVDSIQDIWIGADWNEKEIDDALKEYQASNSLKVPEVNQPIRIALTGSTKSPSLGLTLSLFDKEESLKRIEKLINFLN